ncbi:MAG: MarR family winged helix-turn-helix transcriptional regulator [Sulfurimonas sp.]|nr:MarR family winged helix-turn-helix transcriptional regulator [Sulfurimonas sp.]
MNTYTPNNHLIPNFYEKVKTGYIPKVFLLAFPITLLHKTLFAHSENFYKEKYDLLKSEVDVLASLYTNDNQLTPTQLYDLTIFSSGGMTKVLKRLEIRGYIKRKADEKDKRCMLVCLTPSGEEVIKSSMLHASKEYETYFEALSDTETKELERLLQKLLYTLPKTDSKATESLPEA